MKKILIILIIVFVAVSFVYAGGKQESAKSTAAESNVVRELAPNAVISGTVVANEVLEDGTKGVDMDVLTLTPEDEKKIREGGFTAAIALQILDASWPQQQIAGMKSVFDKYNVEVVSITGGGGKPELQIENIENVIALKPDVLLSIPVDPSAEGPVFKEVAENGIEIILLDMIPAGLQYPEDYSCLVSSSSYGNGVSAADIMADAFIKAGITDADVAVMKLNFSHFVTEERVRGFLDRINEYYPWINPAVEADFPYDMPKVTEISAGMLTANQNLDGAFVVWMVPAMSLVTAARDAGKDPSSFVITTVDLEEDGAMEIASGGYIKGTGAQDPYKNGVAEALAACRAMIGYENPRYVAVPGYAVNRANIVAGYKAILGEEAPSQIQKAASK